MNDAPSPAAGPLRRYIALPVVAYSVAPLLFFGLLLAAAYRTAPPDSDPELTQPLFWLYVLLALLNVTFALVAVRQSRREGRSVSELLAPAGLSRAFRWRPALLLFVLYNTVWLLYVALYMRFTGEWPSYGALPLWQRVLFLTAFPVVAGLCEELYWRGFLLPRLQRAGLSARRAIIIAALGFSLIHGFFLVDKLLVALVIGLLAGWYYQRERTCCHSS